MLDSPVNLLLKNIIDFNKSSQQAIYIQISQQIMNAIQRKYLTKGTLLPGTRVLSKLLKIHRNTAVAVYDELASQGWVEIIPNKGTYVLEPEKKKTKLKYSSKKIVDAYTYPTSTGFPFQESFHLAPTNTSETAKFSINDGKPDLRLHPTHQFTRWYTAAMNRKTIIKKWNDSKESSSSIFKSQLCNYLNATRGFYINPNNILNTRSSDMSLFIISQLLLKKGDVVLVGSLSNYNSNMIFQESGAIIKTIPLDHYGLDVNYIRSNFKKGSIRCLYVCSQRDYPTLVTLNAERRLDLIQLSKEYEFAIIEDDYDHDFQYEGSAMLPMATADSEGMVIYLGKLGQSLFPNFQIGFIVAPKNFITEANNYLKLLDKQGDFIQEQIITELINEGEIYRLTKKNIVAYRDRRDHLCQFLKKHFSKIATWKVPTGGLAIWLEFSPKISLIELSKEAKKNDLFLPNTILYQNKDTCAIRFGFGHLNFDEIEKVILILKFSYNRIS